MSDTRVETGPVQFGDDWPGLFIRGDNALGYALALRTLLENEEWVRRDVFALIQLEGLRDLLFSCDARRGAPVRVIPIAAPPAPPVATTGAVPRDSFKYLLDVARRHFGSLHNLHIPDDAERHLRAADLYLSAAPAPKASEGEETREAHSYSTTHTAQPHARAEGATWESMNAAHQAVDLLIAKLSGTERVTGREAADACDLLRRFISGSAEGRP